LPSYVDEICSKASKLWIEEHLQECEQCRATAELMKNTEISAKRLEQEGFDAAKKILRQNQRRSILGLSFCFLLLVLMVYMLCYDHFYGQIPPWVIYVALPVCMTINWLVSQNQIRQRKWDRWDTVSLVAILTTVVYGIGLMFFGMLYLMRYHDLFGMPPERIGPFMNNQCMACLLIGLALYLLQMGRTMKQGRAGSVVQNICLIVVFLMPRYRLYMGNLDTFDGMMKSLTGVTCFMLFAGGAITALFAILDKRLRK